MGDMEDKIEINHFFNEHQVLCVSSFLIVKKTKRLLGQSIIQHMKRKSLSSIKTNEVFIEFFAILIFQIRHMFRPIGSSNGVMFFNEIPKYNKYSLENITFKRRK